MVDNLKISVIIPVKNHKNIENCLKAVLDQSVLPYEVIVVDGHSTDGTVEVIKKYPVKYVTEEYGTIGGARQVGIETATGDLVAFTDADCIPEKDWLSNLAKNFNNNIVGVGGGMINRGNGVWQESISKVLDTYLGSANSVQDRVFKEKRFVNDISGCNCIYKKSDVDKVGGFNVKLSLCEDTDLNVKLLKYGKILFVPDANVVHNQNRSIRAFIKRMYLFGYGRGYSHYFDLPVIPPIIAVIVLLFLFISVKLFLAMILVYLFIVLIFTTCIIIKTKKIHYIVSVPIIYFIEHIAYTIGFYAGILHL